MKKISLISSIAVIFSFVVLTSRNTDSDPQETPDSMEEVVEQEQEAGFENFLSISMGTNSLKNQSR